MFKKTLILSLLLHLCLFLKVSDKKTPPKKKPKVAKSGRARIIFSETSFRGNKKCKRFYIGLGVSYSYISGEISDIAPKSPAYFNDIRIGDILGTFENYAKLKAGTSVEVVLIRNGITIIKKMKIDKICTNGE